MDTLKAILENLIGKYVYAFPTNGTQIFDDMILSGTVGLYEAVWNVCADNNLRSKRLNFKDNLIAVLGVYIRKKRKKNEISLSCIQKQTGRFGKTQR
jgi:hypothetical protein